MQKASLWSPEAFATDPRNLKESVRRLSIKVEQGGSESDNFFLSVFPIALKLSTSR